MTDERNKAKVLKLLQQLRDDRAADQYAEDYPQEIAKPGRAPTKLPTLDPRVFHPVSPMLAARFAFAGEWKNAFIGMTWLSAKGMQEAAANRRQKTHINVLRKWWDGSVPADYERSQISLFATDRTEPDQVFLVWEQPGKEPKVAWYASQHEHRFDNFAKYAEFLLDQSRRYGKKKRKGR